MGWREVGGQRRRGTSVEGIPGHQPAIDASQIPHPRSRLQGRMVEDGERTYHSYSAHELMELESLVRDRTRPGQPY